MKDKMNSSTLMEYFATLDSFLKEHEAIGNRIAEILYSVESIQESIQESIGHGDQYELSYQIQKEIREIQKTQNILEKYAQILRRIIELYETTPPALMDIISSIDVMSWWEQAYPIIEQIATVTGAITGITAFIKWVRSKLQEKEKEKEYKWIKYILNEDEWNTSILAQQLELTESETKKLLKGFGYVWDAKRMLYIATENTYKLRDIKINRS